MAKLIQKATKAAGAAAGVAALVNVQMNDVHHEIDKVSFAGIPLFKRDDKGNPSILGIRFRRRRGPRAEP
jgi:diadenosine tetraphosphate (Ap4A) HIT family hydrolase